MVGELMLGANLQALYHLNGNVNDSSVNGYNLTNNGSTADTGKFGSGGRKYVSASSHYDTIADASCANLEISGSQTWIAWLNFTTHSSQSYPVAKAPSGAASAHGIRSDAAGTITAVFSGLTPDNVTSDATITDGRWHFVCVIYDSSAGLLKVWIDGVKKEVSASGSATDTNGDFSIGRLGADNSNYLNGMADEVAVYNKAWSDKEVRDYYRWATGKGARFI